MCRQSPPAPGPHSGRVGCSQNGMFSSQLQAAVAALEEHARVAAGVDEPVLLAGDDRPDPLERLLAAFRQREPLRLLPLPGGIVGDPELRPVEGVRGGGEVPAAAGIARRELDRLAGECARGDLERFAGVALRG